MMKKWLNGTLKSWVIWFNAIMLTAMEFIMYARDFFQELQPFVSEHTYKTMGLILIAGNIILRFKTNKSLAEK